MKRQLRILGLVRRNTEESVDECLAKGLWRSKYTSTV